LFGWILSLPFVILADRYRLHITDTAIYSAIPRTLFFIFFLYMAHSSAAMTRLTINSVSYSNLQTFPPLMFSAIIYGIAIYVIIKNGRGIGNASKLWFFTIILLSAIIILASLKDMDFRWITPILGPGIKTISHGALIAAGQILTGSLIIASSDGNSPHSYVKATLIGSAVACLLCLYWSFMTPMQLSEHINRLTGIEMLLSNGRTSLAVLLPMAIIWFMALIATIYGSSFASAIYCQVAFGRIHPYISAAITATLSFLFASLRLAESNSLKLISPYCYGIAAVFFLYFVMYSRKRQAKQ